MISRINNGIDIDKMSWIPTPKVQGVNQFRIQCNNSFTPNSSHLFIGVLIVSDAVVDHQAVIGWRPSVQGVDRLGVVAHVGLLGHCTVEGSVLLRLNTCT